MKSEQNNYTVNGLPKGWKWVKLGEACEVIGGGTPSRENKKYFGGEILWLTPTEIEKVAVKTINDSKEKITPLGLQKSSAKKIPAGSVLLTSRATIGNVAIAGKEVTTNQGFSSFVCQKYLCNKFLAYWLKSIKKTLTDRARGTTFKEISKSEIKQLDFPLPSLHQQQLIVSKIEDLFSELDKGIEQLKTAQQQLKIYRQAVLKAAFEGKLTQRKAPQAGVEPLSMAAEDETEYNKKNGLPKGWKWVKIGDVANVNPKLPNKENIHENLEVQFLPMKLVEEVINKIHLIETKKYKEVQKRSYTPFIDGDIIFAKVTPCMENGKIAVVDNLKNGIGYGSSEFHVIRCFSDAVNKYIFYFIVQNKFRSEAENAMTGAVGLRRVPKQFIEGHIVPLPPIEEQHLIIEQIETCLSVADKMEESINESLQQAEALRQSILKKAFEGRLI